MPKEVMTRQAADNVYLHKDFHGALSRGIDYLHQQFGAEAVREYLWQFATAYYAPLKEDLRRRGLVAIQEHLERVYRTEGAAIQCTRTADELRVEVAACPAVMHLRSQNVPVAELFHETTRTVNAAICDGTPFAAELVAYDPATGRGIQRFYRRPS
jgi:hypothetical protein